MWNFSLQLNVIQPWLTRKENWGTVQCHLPWSLHQVWVSVNQACHTWWSSQLRAALWHNFLVWGGDSMILADPVTFGVLLTSSEKDTIFPPVFLMKANNGRNLGYESLSELNEDIQRCQKIFCRWWFERRSWDRAWLWWRRCTENILFRERNNLTGCSPYYVVPAFERGVQ